MSANLEMSLAQELPGTEGGKYSPRPEEGLVGHLVKTSVMNGYKLSGLMALQERLRGWRRSPHMTILLFHRVTDEIPADGLTVGVDLFRDFCALMRRSYHVVPLGEIFRTLDRQERPARRTVAITFDDCYADNLAAAEVLHEHGLPATFFVPTQFVGTDLVMPWDRDLPRLANLSWSDVEQMARWGHEIGSHTASHPDLGLLPLEQTRRELVDSKKCLEDHLGRPVRWFAYPFGSSRNFRPAEQLPLVYEAGYEGCVSAMHGFVEMSMRGQILPRQAVPNFRNLAHLELHINRCLDWFYAFKRRVGVVPYDPEAGV